MRRLCISRHILFVAVFACCVWNLSTAIASATSVRSEKQGYGPVGGHSYYNWSELENDGAAGSWGFAVIETQQGSSVSPGWMGADAMVYTESEALCTESGWFYNSITISGWDAGVTGIAAKCGSQYYQGTGLTRSWDGSTYNTYGIYSTPFLYI